MATSGLLAGIYNFVVYVSLHRNKVESRNKVIIIKGIIFCTLNYITVLGGDIFQKHRTLY